MCLGGVTFNQKVDGEWIRSDGRIVWGTYRVKSSKSIISPNIIFNIYLKFIIFLPGINPFFSNKNSSLIYFMSTHGHRSIYKSDTINIINSFINYWNNPVILNLYVQYSNTSHSLVISGILYAPVSYEKVPTNNEYY